MKKLLAIALLLCTGFSLSSFENAPKPNHTPVIKKGAFTLPFPITGTTWGTPTAGGPAGNYIDYEIHGSGDVPTSVTLYDNRVSPHTQIASYMFTTSSPNLYTATGMKSVTTITAIQLHVNSAYSNGYLVEVIGL